MRAFVFVDIRADTSQPQLVVLTVRNQGQSVAWKVQVVFEPPLVPEPGREPIGEWTVSTLAPGAHLARSITSGRVFFNSGIERDRQRVTVKAEDAHGPLEVLTYDIDLAALATVTSGAKTIYHVWQALEKIAANTAPGKLSPGGGAETDG